VEKQKKNQPSPVGFCKSLRLLQLLCLDRYNNDSDNVRGYGDIPECMYVLMIALVTTFLLYICAQIDPVDSNVDAHARVSCSILHVSTPLYSSIAQHLAAETYMHCSISVS
jgi:hypothetical protein